MTNEERIIRSFTQIKSTFEQESHILNLLIPSTGNDSEYKIILKLIMKTNIEIAPDGKKAFLTVLEDPEKTTTGPQVNELKHALSESGVICGINEKILRQICIEQSFNRKFQVAEAIPPKVGENAKIRIKIAPKKPLAESAEDDPDKKIDHYGVREGFITFIRKGTILATRIPPTIGKDGYTVRRENIKGLLGSDISLDVIQGDYTKIEGSNLVAKVDGIFKRRDNKLHIEQIIELKQDLGIKTGSIILPLDADIELIIPGDIKSGFSVQCNKIMVAGTVEDAKVTARFLEVKKGIVGTSDLPIKADFLTTSFVIGKRRIKSRVINILREISGGSSVESDFVCSQIIQECSITAKYGVWTKYLYGKNSILVGVDIKENEEYQNLTKQLQGVESVRKDTELSNQSLLKKDEYLRSIAKRMPNNPSIAKELIKLQEVEEKILKLERIKETIEEKLRHLSKSMYIFEDPFILVELGFTKKIKTGDQLRPVNDLTIKDSSYERNKPHITGLYSTDSGKIIVNQEYNVHEISSHIEKYKKARLVHYKEALN